MKSLFKSKRFWAGIIALLTGISVILTGEKAFSEMVGEIVLTAIGLIQTIIAITSGSELTVGGRSLAGK